MKRRDFLASSGAVVAGVGILVGVAFTLRAIQRAFFADPPADAAPRGPMTPLDPISIPERLGAVLLIIGVFAMLYVRERRLWIWLQPAPGGGTRLRAALSTTRRTLDADAEFETLKTALLHDAQPEPPPSAPTAVDANAEKPA